MSDNSHEVFRGHIEECLQRLQAELTVRQPKGSKGAAKLRKPIADFCGVTVETVARWFFDSRAVPIGERYFKLMCYLDMVGYRVIELERMQKVRRNFAELIGYGLLSGNQAAGLIGFSHDRALYRILRGEQGTSNEKERKMWDAWKERKEELQQRKEKSFELYGLNIHPTVRPKAASAKASGQPLPDTRPKAVVAIMEGLLVLLEENSFDILSDSNLADLKQSVDTILRLSARLSTLSSRLVMFGQQRKGG